MIDARNMLCDLCNRLNSTKGSSDVKFVMK
jgi:hypothetical protein